MRKELCSTCNINPRRNHTSYKCKECHNDYQKAYYKKNPSSIRTSVNKQSKKIRDFIKEYKNKPCTDCGETYPYYVMDLDHIKGSKSFNLSEAASKYRTIKRIQEEIDKCELVCANCHRIRTFTRLYGTKANLVKASKNKFCTYTN